MPTSRLTVGALVLACCSLAGGGYAAAQSGSGFRLRARPRTIYYHQPRPRAAKISGQLSGAGAGTRVLLQARRWPFQGSFKRVASEQTSRYGRFAFVQRPSLATQYRVSASGSTSGTRTVYVYPGYRDVNCSWSGPQGQGVCSKPPSTPGQYTIHFTFDYLYPPSVLTKESGLPVFVYFAECFGCSSPPSKLDLKRKVSQNRNGPDSAHVSIKQRFSVRSGQKYFYQLNPCLRTTEQSNGFGLPGPPGSHHCGDSSVPTRYFSHGRQLG